jgi:NADPH:quinone reductase-like Zn-dependent oxidoreductase
VPILCPAGTQLVFEAQAVALHPSDLKQIGFVDLDRAVLVYDYAGVVNKVSKAVHAASRPEIVLPASFMGGLYADRGNPRQYLAIVCNA